MIGLKLHIFGKNTKKWCILSLSWVSICEYVLLLWCSPWSLTKINFGRFHPSEVTIFPFAINEDLGGHTLNLYKFYFSNFHSPILQSIGGSGLQQLLLCLANAYFLLPSIHHPSTVIHWNSTINENCSFPHFISISVWTHGYLLLFWGL